MSKDHIHGVAQPAGLPIQPKKVTPKALYKFLEAWRSDDCASGKRDTDRTIHDTYFRLARAVVDRFDLYASQPSPAATVDGTEHIDWDTMAEERLGQRPQCSAGSGGAYQEEYTDILESENRNLKAEIERLRERCEAYKGQVQAGAAQIKALTSTGNDDWAKRQGIVCHYPGDQCAGCPHYQNPKANPKCSHAEPQEVVWQSMETAPKDGTEVIGIHVRDWDGMFKTTVYGPWTMMFEGGKWVPSWNGFNVIRYMSDFGTEYQDFDGEPTHWQPMPPSSMTRPQRGDAA